MTMLNSIVQKTVDKAIRVKITIMLIATMTIIEMLTANLDIRESLNNTFGLTNNLHSYITHAFIFTDPYHWREQIIFLSIFGTLSEMKWGAKWMIIITFTVPFATVAQVNLFSTSDPSTANPVGFSHVNYCLLLTGSCASFDIVIKKAHEIKTFLTLIKFSFILWFFMYLNSGQTFLYEDASQAIGAIGHSVGTVIGLAASVLPSRKPKIRRQT